MAQFANPDALDDYTVFLVGRDEGGRFFVCENHGVVGGDFADRAAAIDFARCQSQAVTGSLVIVTAPMIA